ncbi:hypothetical protein DESACE_06635 [Desulfurella acetivorans A63]|nr:hypothetical protein DESACE_06635 [Desulfurella acetivorans A63]
MMTTLGYYFFVFCYSFKETLERLRLFPTSSNHYLHLNFNSSCPITNNNLAKTQNNINLDYAVNLLDIEEEDRIIRGIHDIYGKLYDEIGFSHTISNPARNRKTSNTLKEIVLARIANPESKRASVLDLEENFGIKLDLNAVYRMMDKITDKSIEKLNELVYKNTKSLFRDKIDVIYFDATTLYFESFTEYEFKKNGIHTNMPISGKLKNLLELQNMT